MSRVDGTTTMTYPPIGAAEKRVMALASGLFLVRVVGQLVVSRRQVRWLPPMEQWQSGLLPYPVLFAFQAAILSVQAAIVSQSRGGRGFLVIPRASVGPTLQRLSAIYLGSMIVRYVISMRRFPERRWFGKTIPIWFHCVLATFLWAYARVLRR